MSKTLIASTILGTALATGGGTLAAVKLVGSEAAVMETQAAVLPTASEAALDTNSPATLPIATNMPPNFARVISVKPVKQTITTPRQQCRDEVVQHTEEAKDKHQITGIAAGAVIGGLLGNQVGDGRGRDLATLAGAVAGGFGGKKVQQDVQTGKTVSSVEQRCETVYDSHVKIEGYTVQYEVNGQLATVRMDYDPGQQIPINNGMLMI